MDAHAIIDDEEDKEEDAKNFDKWTTLIVGTNPKDWPSVISRLKTQGGNLGIGFHPWFVVKSDEEVDLEEVKALLDHHPTLRVGEIGLDKSSKHKATFKLQLEVFLHHMTIAGDLHRSVSIHCVRAHGDLVRVLTELNDDESKPVPPGIYLHSWSGSAEVTKALLRLHRINKFLYFGISLKINAPLRPEIIQAIPKEKLLVESDLSFHDPNRLKSIEQAMEVLQPIVSKDELRINLVRFIGLMSSSCF